MATEYEAEITETELRKARTAAVQAAAAVGDVVIVLTNGGMGGLAFIRGHQAPLDIHIDFGEREGTGPSAIRRVTVKAGWTAAAWKAADDDTRADLADGTDEWQAMQLPAPSPSTAQKG